MKTSSLKINPEEWSNIPPSREYLYSLHNNLLSEVSLPSNISLKSRHIFSNKILKRNKISNQESSGRCWIFAGVNVIRNKFIKELNLRPDFEFSQNYLFFWDKFERINYYIGLYEKLNNEGEPLNSQLMAHLLKEPLEDGGQWQMFVNLVEKYGLVPKSVFPETRHSSNSRGLNKVLTAKLRDYCKDIRQGTFNRNQSLKEIYSLLIKFLGKPPSKFTWEYVDKDDKYKKEKDITPIDFYELNKINLNNYVSIVNDPREEYNNTYGVNYLNNIVEGKEVKYLNLGMQDIKTLVKKSIDNNQPVWFGSDVGKYLHAKSNILDKKIFDMEGYLGIEFKLNKRERIEYGDSLMTHAMAITGYNIDNFGNIDRWEIENSWGTSSMNEGYYCMSDDWMSEFVYQVIIDKSLVGDNIKNNWEKDIIKRHPPWDPMGSLAC